MEVLEAAKGVGVVCRELAILEVKMSIAQETILSSMKHVGAVYYVLNLIVLMATNTVKSKFREYIRLGMVFIEYIFIFSVTEFLNQSVPSCDDIMIKDLPRIKLVKDIFLPCCLYLRSSK